MTNQINKTKTLAHSPKTSKHHFWMLSMIIYSLIQKDKKNSMYITQQLNTKQFNKLNTSTYSSNRLNIIFTYFKHYFLIQTYKTTHITYLIYTPNIILLHPIPQFMKYLTHNHIDKLQYHITFKYNVTFQETRFA